MPKAFALFTAGAMASLALPGMSGFASEIAVFLGITSNDVYNPTFSTMLVFLAAVGIIMTPIYLLSMLRLVFFHSNEALACDINLAKLKKPTNDAAVCFGNNCVLPGEAPFDDANPREIFIAACFLALILSIGIYPKLATQMYDAKTVAINARVHQSQIAIAQQKQPTLAPVAIVSNMQ